MTSTGLLAPMTAHVAWSGLLYAALTVAQAPTVWGIGVRADGTNPFRNIEPRISANLKNQFEWPVFFYVACLLALQLESPNASQLIWLAWLFVVGRVAYSAVQVFTKNVRLRGVVFILNFLAVFAMWGLLVIPAASH